MGAFVKALGSASIYGEPADPAMVRRRSGQRSDNGRRFSNRPKGEINHNQTVVMFGDVSDLDCYFLLGPIRMRLCGRASRRVEDRNTLAGPAAAHRPRQSAPPPPPRVLCTAMVFDPFPSPTWNVSKRPCVAQPAVRLSTMGSIKSKRIMPTPPGWPWPRRRRPASRRLG